jgi:hypothetical protein
LLKKVGVKVCHLLLLTLIVEALSPRVNATPLFVANPSFELPTFADGGFTSLAIPPSAQGGYGWTFTDASGIYNPPAIDFTGAAAAGTPSGADGSQVGFSANRYPIFQRLAGQDGIAGNADDPLLTPLTTYKLTLSVGQRLAGNMYGTVYGGYSFELIAGLGAEATVIAQEIDAVAPPPGTFVDRTITVDSTSLNSSLYGLPISIRMAEILPGATAATDFDNVRLDAVTIPEVSTCTWVLAASLLLVSQRRRLPR